MQVAFVVGSFPELSETFVLDQVTGLLDRGHSVTVFARAPATPGPTHGAFASYRLSDRTVHWERGTTTALDTARRSLELLSREPVGTLRTFARSLDVRRFGKPAATLRVWAHASATLLRREGRFDAIVAHFGPNARHAEQLRELGALRGPLVSVFHGRDLSQTLAEHGPRYYERLFAHGERMWPVSDYFAARLRALGCPRERIEVMRMGVDVPPLAEVTARVLAPGETPRLLSVSRLVEKKGLEYGVRAAALLVQRGVRFRWRIVGDGPEREALTRLVRELRVHDHVELTGALPRERVQDELAQAHALVAPSVTAKSGDEEGIPVALMEAAARALPVVSTWHSGIPELVRDGQSGYLVAERDEHALAVAIAKLLGEPERWHAMGLAGRAIVERDFDRKRQLDRVCERLEQLASG